jgi:hypothetical protein
LKKKKFQKYSSVVLFILRTLQKGIVQVKTSERFTPILKFAPYGYQPTILYIQCCLIKKNQGKVLIRKRHPQNLIFYNASGNLKYCGGTESVN